MLYYNIIQYTILYYTIKYYNMHEGLAPPSLRMFGLAPGLSWSSFDLMWLVLAGIGSALPEECVPGFPCFPTGVCRK